MKITHLMTEFLSMTKREKEEEGRVKGARPPYALEEAAVKGETRGFNRGRPVSCVCVDKGYPGWWDDVV